MGTPWHGKQIDPDKLVWAIAALAAGLGIRAGARGFEVAPHTVLGWLVEAAEPLEAFSRYHLCDLHVEQVQMDALFAWLSAVKEGEVPESEAIQRLARAPHWVWVAMDPVWKLILAVDVGERTLAMAQRLVHRVPRCWPQTALRCFARMDCARISPRSSRTTVTGFPPSVANLRGPSPYRAGCRCPGGSRPRSSNPSGAGASSG